MKLIKSLLYSLPILAFISCTEVEKIEYEHIGGYNTMNNAESEEYYSKLREYRSQMRNYGRPVAFGWFSDWAPMGTARKGYLSSVPDSMDIISMWGGAPKKSELTEDQRKDKEFVQKVKGIKLLEVSLLSHLGKGRTPESVYEPIRKQAKDENWSVSRLSEALKHARWDYWGFTSHDLRNKEELMAAHSKYAKALCDGLFEDEWDGFDIDWEPGAGFNDADGTLANSPYQNDLIVHLVKEMGKYIGPMSPAAQNGEDYKLFCIDGHLNIFERACPEYIDYFIMQSYGGVSGISSQTPWKYITCENFEKYAVDGCSILKQAAYCPDNGPKGGFGAYRFTKDYDNTPAYKWMSEGIRINQRTFKEKYPDWTGAPAPEAPTPEQN